MREMPLKYGCNPNQVPARVLMEDGRDLPFRALNGSPGYINLLDALNAWQLVRELKQALRLPAAASFKHVSPAGAAVGLALSPDLKKACFADDLPALDDSPLACACARARGADRLSSFGDWTALSDRCDAATAALLKREVSDGVIAPGYDPEALEILKGKRKGAYCVLQMDEGYEPFPDERRQVFGVTLMQRRNDARIGAGLLQRVVTAKKGLPPEAERDLSVALLVNKYTQSNSVCFAVDGQAVGVGAGQQSRVHCVRLAADKADRWRLRQHGKTLALKFREGLSRPDRDNAVDVFLSPDAQARLGGGGWKQWFEAEPEPIAGGEKAEWLRAGKLSLGSDAFFPFPDSIERAAESGAGFVAQPGGSIRDEEVIRACDRFGMVMALTGTRLFHH